MTKILFILYMAFLARASGGGFGADKLPSWTKPIPEMLFGLAFGGAVYLVTGNLFLTALAGVWSYAWMETGHGTILQWGASPEDAQGERRQRLTPVIEFLSDKFGFTYGDINYCRLFMAVKGFLIGLPVGGIVLAILWPLAYETKRWTKNHALTEMLSGVFAAVAILIFVAIAA